MRLTPPEHYIRGPSGAARIMACPGCPEESAGWPELPSDDDAIDGTHTHTLFEYCLRQNLKSAQPLEGMRLMDHEGIFTADIARCLRVNVALDYVWSRVQTLKPHFFFPEHCVDAGAYSGIPGWKGWTDLLMSNETDVEVIDYKDGYRIVAPDCAQLVSYGKGALNSQPIRRFKRIRLTVIQPIDSVTPIKSVDFTVEEFERDIVPPVENAMRASMVPGAPRVAGRHCRDCRGAKLNRCKAFNRKVFMVMQNAYPNGPVPGNPFDPDTQYPQPSAQAVANTAAMGLNIPSFDKSTLTDEQLADVLDMKSLIKEWFSECDAEALKRKHAGRKIPRHKVVTTPTRTKYKSKDKEEVRKKIGNMGLKKKEYIKETVLTPAQIMATDTFKGWSPVKKKNFQALVAPNNPTFQVVPDTDPRPEAALDKESLFGDMPTTVPEPAGSVAAAEAAPAPAPDFMNIGAQPAAEPEPEPQAAEPPSWL